MKSSHIALLSVCSNTFIVVFKLIVGILTGSVAIMSEALHSGLDLVASVIAFFSVRISSQPADESHPYGHGKFENLSGTIETLLIFIAGIWIIFEAVQKLLNPEPIKLPLLGIIVMLIGAVINFVVGMTVKRVGEQTESLAMRSNALHLLTDVYSSAGVAASLVLVMITGWNILDPLIAIGIAFFIMTEAFSLGKESFLPLLDISLSKSEEEVITGTLAQYKDNYIEYHNLRTRKAGASKYIDLHLVVPSNATIEAAHELCDQIEQDIQSKITNTNVVIHLEPETERVGV